MTKTGRKIRISEHCPKTHGKYVRLGEHYYRPMVDYGHGVGNSQYTTLDVACGYIALINVASGTIRAVPKTSHVLVTNHEIDVPNIPTERSTVANRLMNPREIELRRDAENNKQLTALQKAIDNHLIHRRDEIFTKEENWVQPGAVLLQDIEITQPVAEYLLSKGFTCERVLKEVNNKAFYPPTVTKVVGTKVSWA